MNNVKTYWKIACIF